MRGDAEEASKLRAEVRSKDLEFERVSSELESKKELVRALRRDTDGTERVKAEARNKDREIDELKAKLQRAERQAGEAAEQLATLRESGRRQGQRGAIGARGAALRARGAQDA